MHPSRVVRLTAILVAAILAFAPQPTSARRTVFDASTTMFLTGYCSPNSAFDPTDCSPYSMPFSVQIGGASYNSFYVNSNGTVSFGSIESFLAPQNSYSNNFPSPLNYTGPPPQTSLSAYGVPIFSPNFSDGPGDGTFALIPATEGFDGNFAAMTTINSNSFTVNWFSCNFPLTCGPRSVDMIQTQVLGYYICDNTLCFNFDPLGRANPGLNSLILNASSIPFGSCFDTTTPCDLAAIFASGQQNLVNALMAQPVYTMTLTDLGGGFRVDYSYNAGATGQLGVYGFSLPTGTFQATGPLTNQSFFFGSVPSVPEPATWMMMLLGFASIGMAIRRKRVRRTITELS